MLVFNFTFSILFSQIVPTSLARKAHSKTMSSNVDIKSSELSIAIQKKLLGKMVTNRCVAKRLIDDNSGRLLDYINQLIKLYRTEPNTVKQSSNPEKVVKNLIKIIVKISILFMNEQFDSSEQQVAHRLSRQIQSSLMVVVSFHEVDFSYDRNYLIKSFEGCRQSLKELVKRHLSDKSQHRIDNVFNFLTNADFLDIAFEMKNSANVEQYRNIRSEMANGIKVLLENSKL